MKKMIFTILLSGFMTSTSLAITAPLLSDEEVQELTCGAEYQISDHMKRLGFLIRTLSETALSVEMGLGEHQLAEILENSQLLRVHLSAVFPKTPSKIDGIVPGNKYASKLTFQKYLLLIMEKSIAIDKQLIKPVVDVNDKKEQADEVKKLVREINQIIDLAHKIFRH